MDRYNQTALLSPFRCFMAFVLQVIPITQPRISCIGFPTLLHGKCGQLNRRLEARVQKQSQAKHLANAPSPDNRLC